MIKIKIFLMLILSLAHIIFSENKDIFLSLEIKYKYLADYFNWLDQVSKSTIDFFYIPDYFESLKNLTQEDIEFLEKYRSIRKKYQNESVSNECFSTALLAPNPDCIIDPIVDVFYTKNTFSEVVEELSGFLEQEEIDVLEKCFKRFNTYFCVDREEHVRYFSSKAEKLNTLLSETDVSGYLKKMRHFFNSEPKELTSILLFSAPRNHFSAACYGRHLHLRIPSEEIPVFTAEVLDKIFCSVLVHEATHYVSGSASEGQKRQLSECFLKNIEEKSLQELPLFDLEEPLIIAAQMYFIKNYLPDVYQKAQHMFFSPLSKEYFVILEAYLENKKVIDEEFIEKCVRTHQLLFSKEASY